MYDLLCQTPLSDQVETARHPLVAQGHQDIILGSHQCSFSTVIRFIGRLEFSLQIVARDVVNEPVQHYPLCQHLEIKDRLETGRKFFMTSLSNEGVLSKGVTRAAFIFVGTIHVDWDKLTMFVMLGRRQYKCSFRNQVGTGSSAHDFEGLLLISRLTSSSVASKKMLSLSSIHSAWTLIWRHVVWVCLECQVLLNQSDFVL